MVEVVWQRDGLKRRSALMFVSSNLIAVEFVLVAAIGSAQLIKA